MIRSFLIIPFLHRFSRMFYHYEPFVFPEGCLPNISDPSTFETDYTVSEIEIENALNFTLANDTHWEYTIPIDKPKQTEWEDMMRFGMGEA
jgi:hypothetical protein